MIVLSAVEQVAAHLRERLLRGEWGETMPGVRPLVDELGVNHKTVKSALRLLEDEGLLENQGRGIQRRIVLPEGHAPAGLRVALLLFDAQAQGDDYNIDLLHRLEAAGHLPYETSWPEVGGATQLAPTFELVATAPVEVLLVDEQGFAVKGGRVDAWPDGAGPDQAREDRTLRSARLPTAERSVPSAV